MQHSCGFELVDKECESCKLYTNFLVHKLIALCESVQINSSIYMYKE